MTAHIAVLDPAGNIFSVNSAWRRFARENGNPPRRAVGVGANYLHVCARSAAAGDSLAAEVLQGLQAVLAGRIKNFRFEYPCHGSAQRRWYLMNASRMVGTGGIVVAHEDITSRKQAEEALRLSHEALEQRVQERTAALDASNRALKAQIAERARAEERLRQAATVFDSTNEAIIIADANRVVLTVNKAFSAISGYSEAEVVGRNARFLKSGRQSDQFYAELWASLEATGQWQGEIWNRRKDGELYPAWESISAVRNERGEIVSYVSVLSDITALKRAEERLAHLAHHDALTGLANRLLFTAALEQALERARRHRSKLALLFIDVDHFKFINDTLGHAVGDAFLRVLAERLSATVRGEDTVARLGGDEFTVIVEDLHHPEDVAALAWKLIEVLSEKVTVDQHELSASISVGIGVYPDDANSAEHLLKAADAAMYHAKEHGRGTFSFYFSELTQRATERLELENALRRAVERNELFLEYQPIVNTQDGRIVAAEALVRWDHPQRGRVLPEKFIALAEETGLIHALGQWVLRQACADLRYWRELGLPFLRLAVNVSGRQLVQQGFVAALARLLDGLPHGDEGAALELEITESVLQTGDRVTEALSAVRELGVRIAVDDFGTGYSSLSQLRNLPVDALKIDRSFLSRADVDTHSRAIVATVLALGRNLDLQVVGEGVETAGQWEVLRDQGCDLAQGYFFGHPMTADHFAEVFKGAAVTLAAGGASASG